MAEAGRLARNTGAFHSLRQYFATSLITAQADPTDVQRALRHYSLRITLETYVHWWPKRIAAATSSARHCGKPPRTETGHPNTKIGSDWCPI